MLINRIKRSFWKKYRINKTGDELSILNQRTSFWKPFLMLIPSLLAVLTFTLIPFILVAVQAFRYNYDPTDAFANEWSLGNWKTIFERKEQLINFAFAVRNSLTYAIVALPISLTISLSISVAITLVVKKWARNFWQTVFFLPYVTSAIAVSLAFSYIFKDQGIFDNIFHKNLKLLSQEANNPSTDWNAFIIMIVRGVWGNLAFQVLILSTAMLSVNQDLYKSAAIDGASKTKQFFKITLPSIKRTINFLVTFGIIGGIKTFPLALFNNEPSLAIKYGGNSLILMIYHFTKSGQAELAAVYSIVLFLIGITVSFTLRKLVSLIYIASEKIGAYNVFKKIKNQALIRTTYTKA